jgi:hypothetical protein
MDRQEEHERHENTGDDFTLPLMFFMFLLSKFSCF